MRPITNGKGLNTNKARAKALLAWWAGPECHLYDLRFVEHVSDFGFPVGTKYALIDPLCDMWVNSQEILTPACVSELIKLKWFRCDIELAYRSMTAYFNSRTGLLVDISHN